MLNLPDPKNTKIVTRSGPTSTLVNLGVVAAVERCTSVIVLAGCNVGAMAEAKAFSDLETIKTLLAVVSSLNTDQDVPIVAEVFGATERTLASAIDEERIICIDADEVLAKIIVQTSRSSGLALVYEEMLSFDGAELYFFETDWAGVEFSDLLYRFPDGVAVGFRRDGEITINPELGTRLQPGDELLILSSDDSVIELRDEPLTHVTERARLSGGVEQHVERQLIVGYSAKLETIAKEYANYVLDGSQIDVVLRQSSVEVREQIERIDRRLPTMAIQVVSDDAFSAESLLALRPFEYDNIIILSQAAGDGGEDWTDSGTLVILL